MISAQKPTTKSKLAIVAVNANAGIQRTNRRQDQHPEMANWISMQLGIVWLKIIYN